MLHKSDLEIERQSSADPKFTGTWSPANIEEVRTQSGGVFYRPDLNDGFLLQCLRCKAKYQIDECDNCNYRHFRTGLAGVFCMQCGEGVSSWACERCSTRNSVDRTLFVLTKERKGKLLAKFAAIGAGFLVFAITAFSKASSPEAVIGGGCCFPLILAAVVYFALPLILDQMRESKEKVQ